MNGELLSILSAIERDKGIDREILIQAIEAAVATAAKKSEGASEEAEASATLDRKTGRIVAVVEGREVDSARLTRIAAQTAKQVILQKIREAERDVIFTEFQGRVGDIVTGSVHRFERGDIIVELGRAEAVLPKAERIPHEEYHQGDMVQAYVLDVRKNAKGPAIVLSRTHEGFIRGLFHLEVPEIAEGIVEIKGLAREAGDRTKIAVASKDEKVDCVGACVGMRGTRVKNIVRELHGEKVDIIRWHEAVTDYIAAALSPAKIAEIQPDEAAKQAVVIVDDDQLSLAIGKKGQNVRLASKLTGWQLEIKTRVQLASGAATLRGLPGVGPAMEKRLQDAGITTLEQLAGMTAEQLTAIEGIGEKTAQKLVDAAAKALTVSLDSARDAALPAPAITTGGPGSGVEGAAPPPEPPATGAAGPAEANAAESAGGEAAPEPEPQNEPAEAEPGGERPAEGEPPREPETEPETGT
ncbi:MAG: transcription termination/antitermination protein NusA [Candidatus Omnitrophica bacterium]|nr:transcription termination/antitermination protein NusA [Candidatus Omnitrophota bacterium]